MRPRDLFSRPSPVSRVSRANARPWGHAPLPPPRLDGGVVKECARRRSGPRSDGPGGLDPGTDSAPDADLLTASERLLSRTERALRCPRGYIMRPRVSRGRSRFSPGENEGYAMSGISLIRNISIIAHIAAGRPDHHILLAALRIGRPRWTLRHVRASRSAPRRELIPGGITSSTIDIRHMDFTAEVERSLRVIDGARSSSAASRGPGQSEKVWHQADSYHAEGRVRQQTRPDRRVVPRDRGHQPHLRQLRRRHPGAPWRRGRIHAILDLVTEEMIASPAPITATLSGPVPRTAWTLDAAARQDRRLRTTPAIDDVPDGGRPRRSPATRSRALK